MFRTSLPATEEWFHNRSTELGRLLKVADRLKKSAPSWLAVIGPRKVGKTSLVMEFFRQAESPGLVFVALDVFEFTPSIEFFKMYALRVLDKTFGPELGESLEQARRSPARYRAALQRSSRFAKLPADLRSDILELLEWKANPDAVRHFLELPERLAQSLKLRFLIAIDEFQELAGISSSRNSIDPFPVMRSIWQRHKRVGYIVSGSARSMLTELVSAEHSPFFQHFSILDLGPFTKEEAISLLTSRSPRDCRISRKLAERAVGAIGGHPFYLQLLGEELVGQAPPLTEESLKSALQELLFSRTGRLALYFENEFNLLVGKSSFLASALEALSDGPKRLSEIAKVIEAASGATAKYLERLKDAIQRREDGRYELSDGTFGLWLQWRQPGGSVVPMKLLGDEAELSTAQHLSLMGFELVYQSRASRGAFDLLAIRNGIVLGIQVKRSELPLRFGKAEWNRMTSGARTHGWRWVLAAVSTTGEVSILDPSKSRRGKEVRLSQGAVIENLLLWLDKSRAGR